jgi:hypothetical protein
VTSPAVLDLVPRKLGALPAAEWTRLDLPHVRRRAALTQRADLPELQQDSITPGTASKLHPPRLRRSRLYVPRWYTRGRLHVYADGELIFSSRVIGGVLSSVWIAHGHGWLIVVTYLFALRSLGLRHPRTEHILIGAMSALTRRRDLCGGTVERRRSRLEVFSTVARAKQQLLDCF